MHAERRSRPAADAAQSSGQGVIGPKLGGGAVVAKYPDAADQRAVVAEGRAGMPKWSSILSAEELDAVVR